MHGCVSTIYHRICSGLVWVAFPAFVIYFSRLPFSGEGRQDAQLSANVLGQENPGMVPFTPRSAGKVMTDESGQTLGRPIPPKTRDKILGVLRT